MRRFSFFDNPISRVQFPIWRARLVLVVLGLACLALLGRALYLQGVNREFLQEQGVKRFERTLTLPATRGKITDRQGVVLAASIPAKAIWAIPEDASQASPEQIEALAELITFQLTVCANACKTTTAHLCICAGNCRWIWPIRSMHWIFRAFMIFPRPAAFTLKAKSLVLS